MAFTDSLTGLPNRRYFDQAVARELAAIARGGPSAGVIEFDLDFFKEINDSRGHAAGDEVLRQIASLVSGTIRKADMFARYGGEEFILLLPGTSLPGATATAEKLRKQIEARAFKADEEEIRLTASFGVAELNTDPAISCYRSVDRALYRAKQQGRNRVEVMAPGGPEGTPEREATGAA
jgi:diguanylate cyclase (GGDEF)-like protein